MLDIVIIGGGVVGCAIARTLSKYDVDIALVEREKDVSLGASKANSGIVHGGYAGKYGTQKGKFCIRGNAMYPQLEKELNFGFNPIGGVMLAFEPEDFEVIEKQIENGKKVGQNDMVRMSRDAMLTMLPHVNPAILGGVYIPSIGIASPYELTIALAENAMANGVAFHLGQTVTGLKRNEVGGFDVMTDHGMLQTKVVINAAGRYSGQIAAMVDDEIMIKPRKGQYILLGKDQAHLASKVIFQTPGPKGKGILVTPTVRGNLMIGPDAEDLMQDVNTDTTVENLTAIVEKARQSVPAFDLRRSLTTFSGVRAIAADGDFIVERSACEGVYHAAGIDSPGFTSSPAIAAYMAELLLEDGIIQREKEAWSPERRGIVIPKASDFKGDLESDDPEKHIICRCERVTEAEIVDAMSRGILLDSTDAIKRRTRAGMGNCQGQFCGSRVKALMAETLGVDPEQISRRTETAPPPQRVDIQTIRKMK
ncbi:NAD(P)/FAD-dependent oxidoreductase [Fusibacter paucivorans]|uniref:NAD(P)/FAD-dependent oxidoreductase n=1 Tax=Fusibacter paucivorans TaxID=76009 RepID=A0ABS5PST3_9FIRM|nr:NAD(P)/FAD-dependent oxidoreductase [Fusibacter paucivorans]MBS7527611.1 NAD(P)/FAD-dependent oxidoreductase [Fusibacter paucivorans]